MANLVFTFTTQYPGSYYALVHDHKNMFVSRITGSAEFVFGNISNYCFSLTRGNLNTYTTNVSSDKLGTGVYTFRIYNKNGSSFDPEKDELVSVGQTGWNAALSLQTNPNDIISSIDAYEKRQDNIFRLEILLDSVQLGLRNNETGFARIDFDEITSSMKIKSFWKLQTGIIPSRISLRGPAALGARANPVLSINIPNNASKLDSIQQVDNAVASLLASKNFYVTIDTSAFPNGRIGGYPIYSPSSISTRSGTVAFRIASSNTSTGVSFRTS